MFPSGYSSRYNSRQFTQDRTPYSSASSSRPQTPQGGASGYSTRGDYLRDATEYESELGHLLSPPSPPPSLDQILSVGPSASSFPPDVGAIATPNPDNHQQSLYHDFAPASSATPGSASSSSRPQSAASESTSRASQASYARYPGVIYDRGSGKYRVRWTDPSIGQRVSLGSYSTQSEAIRVLEDYKASRSEAPSRNTPGVYFRNGVWHARYGSRGQQVHVGTFSTKEGAEQALQNHRAELGLAPVSGRRGRRRG